MTTQTTLLLTAPPAGLLADIARSRPDWRVVTLGDLPPVEPLGDKVWGFVDWLCPTMSGLELCRRLRESSATRRAHLTIVLDESSQEAKRRALQAGADDTCSMCISLPTINGSPLSLAACQARTARSAVSGGG